MNIIKFKDQIRIGDALFNTYLKGKYAYWIRMRYVVPFEFIDQKQYIEFEQDVDLLIDWQSRGYSEPPVRYWDLNKYDSDIQMYVDSDLTDSANNINPFIRHNNYTPDADITLEELKKFRTWLAEQLLSFDCNDGGTQKNVLYTPEFTGVLQYYAGGMYDVTVKALSGIVVGARLNRAGVSACGCGTGSDISNLYAETVSTCDPLHMYREHMYRQMCAKFADMNFWADFSSVFLLEFKQYILNIINCNLPLTKSQWTSVFMDCSCQANPDQDLNVDILRRLANALQYIADGEISGNKNYITKALQDWAADLYESMEWA